MTDGPRIADFVDLSPYVLGAELGEGSDAVEVPALVEVRWHREPAPSPLDGPGYLVIHRGELAELGPGDAVAIGRMPHGIAGGVAEWTVGTLAGDDQAPA
jgi:hypothetical protein